MSVWGSKHSATDQLVQFPLSFQESVFGFSVGSLSSEHALIRGSPVKTLFIWGCGINKKNFHAFPLIQKQFKIRRCFFSFDMYQKGKEMSKKKREINILIEHETFQQGLKDLSLESNFIHLHDTVIWLTSREWRVRGSQASLMKRGMLRCNYTSKGPFALSLHFSGGKERPRR